MEQLYALVNPKTNKIIQLSQLENLNYVFKHVETVNGNRKTIDVTALCIPVLFTPDLLTKTYSPETDAFI